MCTVNKCEPDVDETPSSSSLYHRFSPGLIFFFSIHLYFSFSHSQVCTQAHITLAHTNIRWCRDAGCRVGWDQWVQGERVCGERVAGHVMYERYWCMCVSEWASDHFHALLTRVMLCFPHQTVCWTERGCEVEVRSERWWWEEGWWLGEKVTWLPVLWREVRWHLEWEMMKMQRTRHSSDWGMRSTRRVPGPAVPSMLSR